MSPSDSSHAPDSNANEAGDLNELLIIIHTLLSLDACRAFSPNELFRPQADHCLDRLPLFIHILTPINAHFPQRDGVG